MSATVPAPIPLLVPGQAGAIISPDGTVWTLSASGLVFHNDKALPSGGGTLALALAASHPPAIWGLSANNNLWYIWVPNSTPSLGVWTIQPAGIGPAGLATWNQFLLDPDLVFYAPNSPARQLAEIISIQTLRKRQFGSGGGSGS